MLHNKHIKKGQFLWWKRIGNSLNQNIDCPCVITQVTGGQFKVRSLDDFAESELITTDSTAYKEEMTPVKKRKAISFLEKTKSAINDKIAKAEAELQSAQDHRAEFAAGLAQIIEFIE